MPLTPANAGAQMESAVTGSTAAALNRLTDQFGDLGPGIRRDERNMLVAVES